MTISDIFGSRRFFVLWTVISIGFMLIPTPSLLFLKPGQSVDSSVTSTMAGLAGVAFAFVAGFGAVDKVSKTIRWFYLVNLIIPAIMLAVLGIIVFNVGLGLLPTVEGLLFATMAFFSSLGGGLLYLGRRAAVSKRGESHHVALTDNEKENLRQTVYQPLFEWTTRHLGELVDGPEEFCYAASPPPIFQGNLLYETKVKGGFRKKVDGASRAYGSFRGMIDQVRREYNNRLVPLMPHEDDSWRFEDLNLRIEQNDMHVADILGSIRFTAFISALNLSRWCYLYCGPSTIARFVNCPPEFRQALSRFDDLPAYPTFVNARRTFKEKVERLDRDLRRAQRA